MRILAAIGLIPVYLALVGSVTWGDVLVGGAVGAFAARVGVRAPAQLDRGRLRRVAALPWAALGTFLFIARGGARMLVALLRPDGAAGVGEVELPFGERSTTGAAITALVASATPGSVLVRMDLERRVLVLNVIDAGDPGAVRAELDRYYQRFQRFVFP